MKKNYKIKGTTTIHLIRGFTLIELMVVVVIVAILSAIALPSYQVYVRRVDRTQAIQEMKKIAEQLERYKARNFNYKGFDASYLYQYQTGSEQLSYYNASTGTLNLPLGASDSGKKYTLTLVDLTAKQPLSVADTVDNAGNIQSISGQRWAMKAEPTDIRNDAMLITSTGIDCEINAQASLTQLRNYVSC